MLGTSTLWNQLRGNVVKDLGRSSELITFKTAFDLSVGPGEASAVAWAWPTLLFTQTLSCIFFGRLSDLVGRRFVFVIGNFIAFIGFLSAGRARNGSTVAGLVSLAVTDSSLLLIPLRASLLVSEQEYSSWDPF
jgi:MFS family permease